MAFLQLEYKSKALMRGVTVKVFLPSDGMAGIWNPPYKTLYFLPGYSATATELITYLGLRGQSELKGIAIVLPDGENLFYQDMPERMTFYTLMSEKSLWKRQESYCHCRQSGKIRLLVEYLWAVTVHCIMV